MSEKLSHRLKFTVKIYAATSKGCYNYEKSKIFFSKKNLALLCNVFGSSVILSNLTAFARTLTGICLKIV